MSERSSYYRNAPAAVVIGCGDLGMACARVLGQRAPIVIADISQERLDDSVAALRHEGLAVEGLVCDISKPGDVAKLGEAVAAGGVRTLAHVAAIGRAAPRWQMIVDVNLVGVHLVARAVGPHMVPGGVGIFISSTGSAMTPTDGETDAVLDDPLAPDLHGRLARAFGREPTKPEAYNLTKRGMNRLMKRLADAWGARQVRALTVSPGIVDTTMARNGGNDLVLPDGNGGTRKATWAELAARTVPLGRQGRIPEVSAVVRFMASDEASFVTGIDIPVDGGSAARREMA